MAKFVQNLTETSVELENNISIKPKSYRKFTDEELTLSTLSYAVNAGWVIIVDKEPTGGAYVKPEIEITDPRTEHGTTNLADLMPAKAAPIQPAAVAVDAEEVKPVAKKGKAAKAETTVEAPVEAAGSAE